MYDAFVSRLFDIGEEGYITMPNITNDDIRREQIIHLQKENSSKRQYLIFVLIKIIILSMIMLRKMIITIIIEEIKFMKATL